MPVELVCTAKQVDQMALELAISGQAGNDQAVTDGKGVMLVATRTG